MAFWDLNERINRAESLFEPRLAEISSSLKEKYPLWTP
jgi:hypothetical protein